MAEIREVLHNQVESLYAIFKEMDKDGNGNINVEEWSSALLKLGLDMPGATDMCASPALLPSACLHVCVLWCARASSRHGWCALALLGRQPFCARGEAFVEMMTH